MNNIPNVCKKGKGWDSKGSRSMLVTYNGVEKSINTWANILDIAVNTLRAKVKKAVDGEITWDVAMMGPDERIAYGNKCRAERLAASAEKAKRVQAENRKARKKLKQTKVGAVEAFLYGNVIR